MAPFGRFSDMLIFVVLALAGMTKQMARDRSEATSILPDHRPESRRNAFASPVLSV